MEKSAYVYLMTNQHNNVLYIGVTNNLTRRVAEHKAKISKGFTHQYNVEKLVYFEMTDSMNDAICREKQLKNWKREWKNELINKINPDWVDLAHSIGVDAAMIEAVRGYYEEIADQVRNDKTQVRNNQHRHFVLDTESPNHAEIADQARNEKKHASNNAEGFEF